MRKNLVSTQKTKFVFLQNMYDGLLCIGMDVCGCKTTRPPMFGSRDINDTDNFHFKTASTSFLKDTSSNYSNSIDMDADIARADIQDGYGSRYGIDIIQSIRIIHHFL
jgi:hypothetical protein